MALFVAFLAAASATAADPDDFFFKKGDRVLFLGDSITEQYQYSTYMELYLTTRFPDWNLTFLNAGIGGDTANGGNNRFAAHVLEGQVGLSLRVLKEPELHDLLGQAGRGDLVVTRPDADQDGQPEPDLVALRLPADRRAGDALEDEPHRLRSAPGQEVSQAARSAKTGSFPTSLYGSW